MPIACRGGRRLRFQRRGASRRWDDGGHSIQVRSEFPDVPADRYAALRLAAAEQQMRGAVFKDGAHESHRSLVVGRGQRVDGEIRLAGQELHDVDEQGNGADLLDPDPRRGGGSKGEVRCDCETFAYQDV